MRELETKKWHFRGRRASNFLSTCRCHFYQCGRLLFLCTFLCLGRYVISFRTSDISSVFYILCYKLEFVTYDENNDSCLITRSLVEIDL